MNNTILWILQIITAITFLYSGICKSILPERILVAKGQTGVEGLPALFIKFIGVSEIAGAAGLIAPVYFHITPWLTPVAALCLAFIMPFAASIHYKRNEIKNVLTNLILFLFCILIAYGRLFFN
ncbi:DoxX family protein [Parafilimonas terrae]|uniref:DoxX family protein n=1 Tax=Parafilimonas terrae TaxID=1465490 RepID=UPI001160B832